MTREPRILNGQEMVSSINGVGKTGQSHVKVKLDSYLVSFSKINWKWIKDFNVRHETIKILEENIGKKLLDTGLGSDFLDMTPKHKQQNKK